MAEFNVLHENHGCNILEIYHKNNSEHVLWLTQDTNGAWFVWSTPQPPYYHESSKWLYRSPVEGRAYCVAYTSPVTEQIASQTVIQLTLD